MANVKAKYTKTSNYSQITPSKWIQMMTDMYSAVAPDFWSIPTPFLWSGPGLGKSQSVNEFAERLAARLGRKPNVSVASLIIYTPSDVKGLPYKSQNERGEDMAKWLLPQAFTLDPSDSVLNVVFLDEIGAATPAVQAAAYQICLDHRVGDTMLPRNTIVICASNRITDKSSANRTPFALANRCQHYEFTPSAEAWLPWAYKHLIDPRIIGFIAHDHKYLYTMDVESEDIVFASPRSWELCSNILKANIEHLKTLANNPTNKKKIDLNGIGDVFEAVAGTVSLAVATEFRAFVNLYHILPHFEDIASGKLTALPKDISEQHPDVMFALSTMIASRVVEESQKIDLSNKNAQLYIVKMLTNIGTFIHSIQAREYVSHILRDLLRSVNPSVTNIILEIPVFADMIVDIGEDVWMAGK